MVRLLERNRWNAIIVSTLKLLQPLFIDGHTLHLCTIKTSINIIQLFILICLY